MLLRPVPANILAAQRRELLASPKAIKRRSPQAQHATKFRTLPFQLAAGESRQLSSAWMRGFLLIQNQSIEPLYIEFGRPPTAPTAALPGSYTLNGGAEFKMDQVCPCDSINILAGAGGCFGLFIEG